MAASSLSPSMIVTVPCNFRRGMIVGSSSSTPTAELGRHISHGHTALRFSISMASIIYQRRNPRKAIINSRVGRIRAVVVDSSDSAHENSWQFVKRMEQAWLISKQPRPVCCSSCDANGYVECKWCRGTGFFILGDNILCEVPSRNTTCVICMGQGSVHCSDCKGTGFRAKWLGQGPLKTAENESE